MNLCESETLHTIIISVLFFLLLIAILKIRQKISEPATDELLKHSQEHFRLAFENAYIGVCLVSTDGQLLSVNRRMCEIFGYSKQELEGMNVNTITHPDYRNISPTFIKKAASGEISHAEFEKQYIHKQGNMIWGKVSSSIIRDNQEKPLYFISYVQDITERRLIEEIQSFLLRYDHIAAGESFFRSLSRYLAEKLEADYVCIDRLEDHNLSAHTLAVWHDGKFEDNLTYSLKDTPCGDVVGKTICSYPKGVRYLFPKDAVLQQMNAEGYMGTTLRSSDGQPIGLIALIWRKPITNPYIIETVLKLVAMRASGELEREQAEEALRENIREYRSLFENMISGFAYHQIIFDENGKPTDYIFLEINSAFEKHTGLSREIIGKRVTEVLPGIEKHDPDFISIYGEVASSGKSVRFDVYAEPQQKFYTISAYSPKKGYFAAVFDDITERRNAEKELRRKSEELATVLDAIPALVWIAPDPECRLITGNRAVNELFGIPEGTNVSQTAAEAGKALRIRHLKADGTEFRAEELPMQRAIALGQPVLNQEFIYDLSDGRKVPALGNAVPLFDENGNVRGAVGAFWDITERKQAEEALYTRLHLREYADSHTLDELLQYTLDKAEQLTGSRIGFFHFLSADQKILTLQMWSGNTMKNMCTAEGKGAHYLVEQAGVWADCVRQQKPVIHNDYSSLTHRKGMPEGHAPVIRELTLPVIRGNRITAIIGIGNKPSDYTEADVRIVSELADMSWDIISNKLAEDALKRSEERYRKAQTLGKVGNWEYNIQTTHFWGSDEAKKIYGFALDSEHFTTEEVENCIPERERVHQALLDLIKKDADYNLEFDIITKNTNERKTIISIAQLERDINGKPLKITGVIQDITERKLAEERLRKSEEQYRLIIETAMEGIWLVDLQGKTLFINQRMANMLGYTVEEIQGADVFQFLDPSQHQEARVSLQCRQNGVGEIVERCFIRKDGSALWTLNSTSPIRDSQGKVIGSMGMLSDITERKRAEAEKAKLEFRLRQAQSMEAIGTLAGGIAHDFNNILFPILGYTEMTMDDLPSNSMAYQNLSEVLKAALRAKELVNQILTFSRQRENEKMILKIQPVVKEALKLIRSTLPTTIELSQNIDPNCNPVLADPTQIHQIIMNLCTNAYHAMQDHGGLLEVTLTEAKLGADDLRAYPGSLPGTYLKLSVSDTGIGIAKDILERIFDPFFTTKPVGKGTGLGLSVVHGIVKQMGGHIRVYSEPGKGTVFHVYMPAAENENISDRKTAVSDESVPTGSERILLTDDEVPILNMLRQMLEELGYRVIPYADSSEAFKAFEKMPDSFDLVITDMTMPNMTGAQLAKKILEIRADMPIILCTGFSEQINGAKSEEFGIKGYLMKPVIRSEMAKMIRKVLRK